MRWGRRLKQYSRDPAGSFWSIFYFLFAVLGMKSRALHMLGGCSVDPPDPRISFYTTLFFLTSDFQQTSCITVSLQECKFYSPHNSTLYQNFIYYLKSLRQTMIQVMVHITFLNVILRSSFLNILLKQLFSYHIQQIFKHQIKGDYC